MSSSGAGPVAWSPEILRFSVWFNGCGGNRGGTETTLSDLPVDGTTEFKSMAAYSAAGGGLVHALRLVVFFLVCVRRYRAIPGPATWSFVQLAWCQLAAACPVVAGHVNCRLLPPQAKQCHELKRYGEFRPADPSPRAVMILLVQQLVHYDKLCRNQLLHGVWAFGYGVSPGGASAPRPPWSEPPAPHLSMLVAAPGGWGVNQGHVGSMLEFTSVDLGRCVLAVPEKMAGKDRQQYFETTVLFIRGI